MLCINKKEKKKKISISIQFLKNREEFYLLKSVKINIVLYSISRRTILKFLN